MKRASSANRGFTLIELMIVIAILGILLSIALPAYSDYSVRTRISEGLTAMLPAKLAVAEYATVTGALPTSSQAAGVGTLVTAYVSGVSVNSSGAILVDIDETGVGATGAIQLVLAPSISGNAIVWNCLATGTDPSNISLVPANCRS